MAMPARFKCYSCGFEHPILEREYDSVNGERFARSMFCPEDPQKIKKAINEREFYSVLHTILNPRYASA